MSKYVKILLRKQGFHVKIHEVVINIFYLIKN